MVAAWETFDDGEDEEAEARIEPEDDRLLVAVTELDGWAVVVEVFGYLGSLPDVIRRLADGTRLVSHFRNAVAVDHFNWWEQGSCGSSSSRCSPPSGTVRTPTPPVSPRC